MFKKYRRKLIKKIKVVIEYTIAISRFIMKLFKVVIVNRKNNKTVDEILLLLKREYDLISSEEQIFCLFRNIYRAKIPKNIKRYYIEFKDKKRFNSRVERLRKLLYWINELDKTDYISRRELFMQELYAEAVDIVLEKAKKTRGAGTIKKDVESLKDIFDLADVYEKKLKNPQTCK